jgi:hypothetical protein
MNIVSGNPYLERRQVHKVRFISPKAHTVAATGATIRGGFDQYRKQDLSWGTERWGKENFYQAGDFIVHVGGKVENDVCVCLCVWFSTMLSI